MATAIRNGPSRRWSREAGREDQTISVIRDGQINNLPVKDILVGDICQIFYGHIVPADGIVVESNDLKIDESSLTGETDLIKKSVDRPMLFSGSWLFFIFLIYYSLLKLFHF